MTVGKPPKTGVDKRPYEVEKGDGTVVRCWYKETAEKLVEMRVGVKFTQRFKPIKKAKPVKV